jgi:predicted SprT family Zn-dependent metalloprotease
MNIAFQFSPKQAVSFIYKNEKIYGKIIQMNPKTALVYTEKFGQFRISYPLLKTEEKIDASKKIQKAYAIAAQFIKKHNLLEWDFLVDFAKSRAGVCDYKKKEIRLSHEFILMSTDEEIKDTILHEIAHALVGKEHNHNKVWQKKAREIGSNAKRTIKKKYSNPKYTVTCENNCFHATRERKRHHVKCGKCGGKIIYKVSF